MLGRRAQAGQRRQALVERDPGLERGDLLGRQRRAQADRVLALDAVARMEDPIGPRRRRWSGPAAPRSPGRAARPGRAGAPSGTSAVGIMSSTVFEACRSRTVEVTPAGLWSSRYSGADGGADDPAVDGDDRLVRIDLHPEPWPALPSTVTRPVAMRTSLARRDATPDAARTFWSRSSGISRAAWLVGREERLR